MLSRDTQQLLRNVYYLGIVLITISVFPAARSMLSALYDYTLFNGITVLYAIGFGVLFGAFLAYKRRL